MITTIELEALRAEAAREILNTDDETVLKKILKLFRRSEATFERIPGLPYTDAEKRAAIKEGMEDIRRGRVHTIEEVRTMFGLA